MRIQNQPNYNYRKPQNFSGNRRTMLDKTGEIINSNSTWFFRSDLNWEKFTDKLIQKYKDTNKVNIHSFACSEGAEPFSLAMLLIKKLGEKEAEKFFPIIASDIDIEILKNPKRGIIKLLKTDVEKIKKLGDDYKNFVEFDNSYKYVKKFNEELCNGKIKPILKNAVVFKNYDIRDAISSIPKENTVVMARNFWPYLPDEETQSKLSKDIANRLGDNSMIVTGDYDFWHSNVDHLLSNNGLNESNVRFCFEKPCNKKQDALVNPEFLMNTFASKHK